MRGVDPSQFDENFRGSVLMLWEGGYKIVVSCEGGRGHAFRYPTIGVKLVGDVGNYFEFRDHLAGFLRSRGCRAFETTLVTCYHPSYRNWVYVEGLDLVTPEKRKKFIETIRRRERRLDRLLEQLC
jgi:hypothetical protein